MMRHEVCSRVFYYALLVGIFCLGTQAATATDSPLFSDGFETGDQSWWTRSEPDGSAIGDVEPDNGISGGGESITIKGAGFTGATDVEVDGISCTAWLVESDLRISCETPPHILGFVRVTVWKNNGHGTLHDAYRFTDYDSTSIDWAAVQWPATLVGTVGSPTDWVYGRAHGAGLTDGAGPPSTEVLSDIGYGPIATLPGRDPGWLWFPAEWFADQLGNVDEFRGSLTCPSTGTFAYAFRCSGDGGLTYRYGDLDLGSADGLSIHDLGVLTCQ